MTDHHEAIAHLLLKQEIEEFFYQEAELLDERRYEEWLELLADDVRYWMPMRRRQRYPDPAGAADPDRSALGRGAAVAHLPYDL
jgi:3-phenylpropionate/cinnamic acid dioxygenase small subunit